MTGPSSSTFEAPWEERAQRHPVNKSLVEPLIAVAYLVGQFADLESEQ